MCGRYYVDEESNQELLKIIRNLDKRLQVDHASKSTSPYHIKTGEIYPSNTVPIISQGQANPCYEAMSWGFVNPKNQSLIINARSESAHQKPFFSTALKNQRIVIPASGFFEWSHDENKTKYYFTDPESSMLYMAGIAKPDLDLSRFVILTTAANNSMSPFHNRMPVLLKKEEVSDYLCYEEYSKELFARIPYQLHNKSVINPNKTSEHYTQMELPI